MFYDMKDYCLIIMFKRQSLFVSYEKVNILFFFQFSGIVVLYSPSLKYTNCVQHM